MKIKIKKEMKLDELIKWARSNPGISNGKNFYETDESVKAVYFQKDTNKFFTIGGFTSIDATFEVEVEEEITEETKFDRLFEVFEVSEGECNSTSNRNTSINESLNDDRCFPIKAFYILNDDLTMTLIWKDGRLVE
ncbi:TPA: hypothetical protein RUV36_001953 [Staphylococcus aureus]|nr:hypothetical protein [Staphylococcus aureus]HDJ5988858.1 hypothetical protein [Staphylococcus aureus]HDN3475476.1 hypothetical protein [Staphylococcus aureus]HEC1322649.1 hypothetical protein [Staphylococcus aureus]